ncbi:TPA: type IV secretion system DotC family protein, partial [Salmonella enterica]|nr:type IV secretion system DotC family protein [Salmonella enterica]
MYQLKVLAYLTILWVGSAAADSPFTSAPAPNLNEVLNGFQNDDANTVRMGVLRDLGETIGFRAGMAWEAQNIANALRERENDLDRIFQFGPLMTTDSSLPPVIVEAVDVTSVSKDQFRTATKVYNIVKQEEFVAVPPTWRDYLFTGLLQAPDIVYPGEDAKPKNSAEKKAWDEAVKKGWADGSQQADQISQENFNRLVRDYTGMLRFSALVKQGMISRTQISS